MIKQRLSYREISSVCLELAMFLHAGAQYGSALELLAQTIDSVSLKNKLFEMGKQSDDGLTLSEVFEKSGMFPADVSAMLQVGEKTGKSEETLLALSKYYDRLDSADSQIRLSVLYPSVLMLVMLTVAVLLISYVLPIFNDVYVSLGKNLTGVGASLLKLGESFRASLPIVALVGAAFLILILLFSFSQTFRSRIFGLDGKGGRGISKKMAVSRFASALSLCISSGLSINESIEKSAELLGSAALSKKCAICLEKISGGEAFGAALVSMELLPAPECRLLELGFKAGSAEAASSEVARRLEREADFDLDSATGKVEPIMVIASSLIIGAILLSVMLPLGHIMSMVG